MLRCVLAVSCELKNKSPGSKLGFGGGFVDIEGSFSVSGSAWVRDDRREDASECLPTVFGVGELK